MLLRAILARHLGCAPTQVPLATTAAGKPYIANDPMAFNLSHSDAWLAVALAPAGSLGVDLEIPRKTRNLAEIARQYFHPDETEYLLGLEGEAQSHAFYRYWTLKEAYFKARGTGIAEGLGKVQLSPPPGAIQLRSASELGDASQWGLYYWLNPLPLAPECHLALVQSPDPDRIELISYNQFREVPLWREDSN